MDDLNFLNDTFEQGVAKKSPVVVLVEDDLTLAKVLIKYLQKKCELEVLHFTNVEQCLARVKKEQFPEKFFLITDIGLENGPDGLLLIDILKEKELDFVSIVITGFGSIETAINATKKGAYKYLTKPFELDELDKLIAQALEEFDFKLAKKKTNSYRKLWPDKFQIKRPTSNEIFYGMIGKSSCMQEVFKRIEKVAMSNSTVLITGPSGTGKELVASAIHQCSQRYAQRMVSLNCGAIPRDILESELFGHMKGSFTGALSNRKGKFELAHRGSIFLDEIGDMPLDLQVKLLRVIQTKQIEYVGGNDPVDVDVRLIAATHRDLEHEIKIGRFREDLYYRLNVIPIKIPALKNRKEDIPILISFFVSKFVSADRSNNLEFSDEAIELLMSYDWPGNVRELENLIERLIILRGGTVIGPEDLPAKIYKGESDRKSLFIKEFIELPDDGIDLKETINQIEDSLILQALSKTSGNKNQASKLLKINRTTLIEKLKKKNLASSENQPTQ